VCSVRHVNQLCPFDASAASSTTLALCQNDRLIFFYGMMRQATREVISRADGSIGPFANAQASGG
jgi:hypothetical protein